MQITRSKHCIHLTSSRSSSTVLVEEEDVFINEVVVVIVANTAIHLPFFAHGAKGMSRLAPSDFGFHLYPIHGIRGLFSAWCNFARFVQESPSRIRNGLDNRLGNLRLFFRGSNIVSILVFF